MKIPFLLAFIVGSLNIQWSLCFIDPITIGLGATGTTLLSAGYYKFIKCRLQECCNDDYVPIDVSELQRQLASRLHGQHIVQTSVLRAFNGYKEIEEPPKALSISFHGPPGTGKNFVADIISKIFYKMGRSSSFCHWFSGSSYSANRLDQHKDTIMNTIVDSLKNCERSMFIFDEVDMMPENLLNVICPFMEYGQPISVEYKSKMVKVISNKAVFLFLSNRGSQQILERITELRNQRKTRDSLSLGDFEDSIHIAAQNEKGGFENSNMITSSLIDYYVPFLPLEEEHVKACAMDAFISRTKNMPRIHMEKEIMSIVTYSDPPHNLYSKSGCKRIEQKVISMLY